MALKFCLLISLSCFVDCRCCVDVVEIEFSLFRVVFFWHRDGGKFGYLHLDRRITAPKCHVTVSTLFVNALI